MKCPKCQYENREVAKFCKECGVNLELACSECGTAHELGNKFCDECGFNFDQDMVTEKYEPKSEGERKHVTVLFTDLSGYTAMSERLDPEDVKEITGKIYSEVSRIVGKYDGFIEKYAGDAVMALFGANQSHEDDPVRAIKTAQEIHGWLESMSHRYENKVGQPLRMHTGINTGLVVTGELNLEKGVHGVAGDAVNVAARLSDAASPGAILVDHETYNRTEGYFQFENLEPVLLKGKANAVQVHKYLSAKKQPQKIHRLHGLRAELIGRKAEMAQLSRAVENLANGQGSVFSLIGTAGTGKSRLIEEFKGTLNLDEIQWREGHAYPYSQNIPYFPLIDLINRTLQIVEGDSPDTIREKVESRIEFLIGEKSNITPYIGSLYALSYPEIENVSPEYWKSKLQSAVLTVLSALAHRGPTIICLEDLHWADPSTIELVHFLLSEIRHPVLFLCVYRPTISPFSTHQIKAMAVPHQELHLQDLSFSEAQNMVESLLKTDVVPEDLQRFIRDKVEGNPFYLEEAVNSLIESKILVPENGDWKVLRPITETEISATIQGVIAARVDRLEQESKRILQEASVIGRSFYYDILKRISEIKDNIDRSLGGLERFDLIKTKSIQPYLEYIFKHALTQEVVYNGLLKRERREIHKRIGYVIEELFKDRLPEFYETLAFHFKNGHSIDKAVHYLMKSGEKSLKRYSLGESDQHYKEAHELLRNKQYRSKEENTLLIDLAIKWAYVYYYRGDFKRLNELFNLYTDLVASLDDKSKAGMFYAWLGFTLYFRGNLEQSYFYLQKAMQLGEETNDQYIIGYACAWLPFTCAGMGLLNEAVSYGERAQQIAGLFENDPYLYYKSLTGLGFAYWWSGETKKIIDAGETIVDFGQKHSNIRSEVLGHWVRGFGYTASGDFPAAIECCQKGIQISKDPFYSQMAKMLLGTNYTLNGQFGDAEGVLQDVITYAQKFGFELPGSMAHFCLGIVSVAKGDLNEGFKVLEELRRTNPKDSRTFSAQLELGLGQMYLAMLDKSNSISLSTVVKNIGFLMKNVPFAAKKAEVHLNKAIDVAKEIGLNGIQGQACLNLGLLHKAKKRVDKAKECISEAIKIFEETDAEGFLKQAREALKSL
jgi:class 3 adenylate cyclase/tetratricopeptide (TPR) repeat protein